ncbi:MAG TPA: CDC27 family protein [Candidatus Saccharimonadales bacterium]
MPRKKKSDKPAAKSAEVQDQGTFGSVGVSQQKLRLVLGAVILVVGAIAGYYWLKNDPPATGPLTAEQINVNDLENTVAHVNEENRENAELALAIAYFNNAQYKEALEIYREKETADPNEPSILKMIALCYINLNDKTNARTYLEKAKSVYGAKVETAEVELIDSQLESL